MSDSEDGKLRGDILVIAIGPAATGKFLLLLLLDQQLQVKKFIIAFGPTTTGKFLLLCYCTCSYRYILIIAVGLAATGKFLLLLLLDQQLQVNSYYYAIGPAATGKFLL